MLDEEPYNVLVTVTGGPEKGVPAITFTGGGGLLGEPMGSLLVIVLLAGLKE